MNKFIFVCYDHGTGGENLSVQISHREYCETLVHTMHASRTWTEDVFGKSLLQVNAPWQDRIATIEHSDLWRVVPSHVTPDRIKKYLPNSVFVVINYPTSQEQILNLQQGIFQRVWLTSHNSLKQKIGFCKQYGYTIDSKEKLHAVDKAVNNAHIHCLMNNLEYNEANAHTLFERIVTVGSGMQYQDDEQTITLEYNAFDKNKLDRLDELCILHR